MFKDGKETIDIKKMKMEGIQKMQNFEIIEIKWKTWIKNYSGSVYNILL